MTRPTQFIRGNTFTHTFDIPSDFADGKFSDWLKLSQVRTANNRMPAGLVTELKCEWKDPTVSRQMVVSIDATEAWPTDLLQVDLLLTSPSGEYYRTPAFTFECIPGVTEVTP